MDVDPERLAKVMQAIDDPCDEGGYDAFCRNSHGELCVFHAEHFRPPEYPCLALLRRAVAERFVREVDERRAAKSAKSG